MQIQHSEEDGFGKFYVEENGEQLAEMTYDLDDSGIMVIKHTQVSDKLKGKGVGKQLVHNAVEYAREQHIKIVPECPFANRVIHETKEYQDVLAS